MFHPESNPLAPKSSGPLKPEKDLVKIWLGDAAAAEMEEKGPEVGDGNLNFRTHELTEKEKKTLWEVKRPDEVTLRNIPKWEELPDLENLSKDFKFDYISEQEYRVGRSIEDFQVQNDEEVILVAKVFDIADAISEAKEKDPKHPNHLTTAEVLMAIDDAGYRAATLEELAAYARDHWKPDADPKMLTKEERELQNVQASLIVALNSSFSSAEGGRCVPYLRWDGAWRKLSASVLSDNWYACHFLVLRKAFPS